MPNARDSWIAHLATLLAQRRDAQLLRELKPVSGPQGPVLTVSGVTYVQFCTNNYLGLADDPEVCAAARDAIDRYGVGSSASRLVAGSCDLHHQLESELAAFKKAPAALLFSTGFLANLAVLTTFAGPHDLILSDKLNHASLLDAARFSGATHRTFPHRDYTRAATMLERKSLPNQRLQMLTPYESHPSEDAPPLRFLVTDSVFSMDGDLADLPTLAQIAEAHQALLVIDEAHATGLLGPTGSGLAEAQHVESSITLAISTLSKAFGSLGGFVTGPRAAIDMLINSARPFIYTTALPPACSAAALAALRIIRREPNRRQRVLALANHVKSELTRMGFNCGDSQTPIIPVILGDSTTALQAAAFLRDKGLYVPAIRPPTVPPNTARLRLSLMATHTDSHVAQLLAALRDLAATLPTKSHA